MVDGNGPSYISAHSADVILSDIRPIKLKADGLRAINVLLDEFLSLILSTSCSLATDKLRASLLSLLPTSLGKEALLEAEVELRAYWERTDPKAAPEDDSGTFHLQWAFSLLRVKCEAYSTLNEQDEDPDSETRVNELFEKGHLHPPKSTLIDPAALYLTAILESMCEHILSNVGRVAARDSSRTSATVNDLFVALCEDDSIYGLFRTMKVYEQIELMSKSPKTRRSKSISRNVSTSRTSSPQQELAQIQTSSTSQTRQSFDGQSSNQVPTSAATSRTSFEKTRAMRMFANNRGASETETQSNHKKSESLRSEAFTDDDMLSPAEDAAMLREFDDLMRSASTMKVSLTPDRLKTMEVYKQEKERNIGRPGPHHLSNSQPDTPRTNLQRPSLRKVDSINEDEEHSSSPKGRTRQASIATPPSSTFVPALPTRSRSVSTSSALISTTTAKKPTRSPSITAAPSAFPKPPPTDMVQNRDYRMPPKAHDNSGFPARTRVRQRNRDSLDLDDVMNGSDDDDQDVAIPVHQHQQQQPRSPASPRRVPTNTPAVSSKTRELMDFLAEGPPEPPISQNGRELRDFLADGPPDYGSNAGLPDVAKPKGTGRLQRMISKLNLGNGEKVKATPDVKSPQPKQQATPQRPTNMPASSLASLANRPIPPRPPRPISPPSSPSMSHDSSDENKSFRNPQRRPYQDASISRDTSLSERPVATNERPSVIPISPVSSISHVRREAPERYTPRQSPIYANGTGNTHVNANNAHGHGYPHSSGNGNIHSNPNPNGNGYATANANGNTHQNANVNAPVKYDRAPKEVLNDAQTIVPVRTTSYSSPARKPVPVISPPPPAPAPVQPPAPVPAITETDVRDMQRLLSSATTANECRLIFDMYLARNGISKESKTSPPYPSPAPSVAKSTPIERSLENSLVELFLGGLTTHQTAAHLPPSEHINQHYIEGMPNSETVPPQDADLRSIPGHFVSPITA